MTTGNQIGTSGVTAGSYTGTNLTVNASGVITSASSSNTPILARVYPSTTQSVTSSSTQLHYNTVSYDTNSFWNTSTYEFLPTVAGYYQVTLINTILNGGAANTITLSIAKNGSNVSTYEFTLASSGKYYSAVTEDIIYLNGSTDYISFYATSATTSTFSEAGTVSAYGCFVYLGV